MTYGNGNSVSYTYDTHGRVTQDTYEDGETVQYQYDNSGMLATVVDSESGIKSTYYYDLIDRLCRYEEAGQDYSFIMEYEFNDRNQVSQMVQTIDGNRRPIEITYDDDGRVTSYRKAEVTESYGYDNLGRLATKTTALDTATRLTETLTYRTNSSGNETGQVNTMSINAPSGYHIYFTYGYDMNGNIAFVKSGDMTTNYTYDSAGQLIREDNQAQGKIWTWVYDNAGNILSKKEYAYTTGALGTAIDTVSYVYDTGGWGDLLKTFDGQAITYDNIGNPLTIGNRSFTWKHGRELATLTENGVTWTNTYNADGLRISRTNGTLTYKYYYSGGQLVRIGVGSKYLDISYDASGVPMALYYSGYQVDNAHYYFVTNLQGDVIAILDDAGTAVVTYTYDAWGNILTVGGTMADTLGVYNPLRYRGYVYDQETSLYYLQSRYYDPEMGRFLNVDIYASTGQGFVGTNTFAFCNNNPINYCDPSGEDAIWLQDTDAVYGAGHTGLLLEDADGNWWHFYWGNNRNGKKGKSGSGKMLLPYAGRISLDAINTFYNYHYGGDYEFAIYFDGDFSMSVLYTRILPRFCYNLLWNNCMQASTDVLSKGKFKYYDGYYDLFLSKIRCATVPNVAFMQMSRFHFSVTTWERAPWYARLFMVSPEEAVMLF